MNDCLIPYWLEFAGKADSLYNTPKGMVVVEFSKHSFDFRHEPKTLKHRLLSQSVLQLLARNLLRKKVNQLNFASKFQIPSCNGKSAELFCFGLSFLFPFFEESTTMPRNGGAGFEYRKKFGYTSIGGLRAPKRVATFFPANGFSAMLSLFNVKQLEVPCYLLFFTASNLFEFNSFSFFFSLDLNRSLNSPTQ